MRPDTGDREDAAITAAVRAASDELLRGSEHPSNDTLLAYHERSLASGDAEGIRDHVALCPDCARRSLDLVAFSLADAYDEDDRPTGQTVKAGWGRLRSTLREEGILDTFKEPSPSWLARLFDGGLFGSLRFAYALAGIFFLTALSTSVWLVKERRAVTALLHPAPFQEVGLRPDTVQRDPFSASGEKIPSTDEDLAFSLSLLRDAAVDSLYRARIFDLRHPASAMWTVESLERDPDGFFSLKIPGRLLPVGSYEIRIYTLDDAVLAEYSFQIVDDP